MEAKVSATMFADETLQWSEDAVEADPARIQTKGYRLISESTTWSDEDHQVHLWAHGKSRSYALMVSDDTWDSLQSHMISSEWPAAGPEMEILDIAYPSKRIPMNRPARVIQYKFDPSF